MARSIQQYLVDGMPEFRQVIERMNKVELDKAIIPVLKRIGAPTRDRLISHYDGFQGKHDQESLAVALKHRWWNKGRKQGKPVGFTRFLALRALITDGFGFKAGPLRKKKGYIMRIKAWGPGIFLTEHGRYKSAGAYTGWRRAQPILKRFALTAQSALNRELPKAFQQIQDRATRGMPR
jgi:hypothetical protein